MILPERWHCLDARAGAQKVITGRGGRLPPDSVLVSQQGQPVTGQTPEPRPEAMVHGGSDQTRTRRILLLVCLAVASVGAVIALRRTRKLSESGRLAAGIGVVLIAIAAAALFSPRTEPMRVGVPDSAGTELSGLHLESAVLVAGAVEPGGRRAIETTIRNARKDAVTVESVETSCGCETAEVLPQELPPGGEGRVRVTLHNTLGVGPRVSKVLLRYVGASGERIEIPLSVRSEFLRGVHLTPQSRVFTVRAADLRRDTPLGVWELQTDVGALGSIASTTVWPTWLNARITKSTQRTSSVEVACKVESVPAGVAPGILTVRLTDDTILKAQFVVDVEDASGSRANTLFRVQGDAAGVYMLPNIRMPNVRAVVRVEPEYGLEAPNFKVIAAADGVLLQEGRTRVAEPDRTRGQVTLFVVGSDGSEQRIALYFLLGKLGE